jgi:uncharacterized protein
LVVLRAASVRLDHWLAQADRRPLVLRGARQVGKTWLVRDLAARTARDLVELNFERNPAHAAVFASNDPEVILGELSLLRGRPIDRGRSLLFLDEIQARPELLAKLRWFYEEAPELPVVAAGSLLEFELMAPVASMPVGRVAFSHVEPMGFDEYLLAHGQEPLLEALTAWRPSSPSLSPIAHDRATTWWQRYAMVGGMPAVVAADVAGQDAQHCRELQSDLMATFRADLAKYAGRMDRTILDAVLLAVARSVGSKFVYAQVGQGVKHHQAKAALERLAASRLCHIVPHSAANGIPLGAEVKHRLRKVVLGDVGLFHALLSTPASVRFPRLDSLAPRVRGQLADQLVGQQLRLAVDQPSGDGPELYYWQRVGGRAGEVDYLVQLQGRILPVEVKAGAAGAMKSLHQFMHDKDLDLAVRCDANPPSQLTVDLATTQGDPVSYTLLSLPHYLVWNLGALVGG